MMDTKFVKDVQAAGWSIQAVTKDSVIRAGWFRLSILARVEIRSITKFQRMTPSARCCASAGKACC